ncbi:MAG: lipoate--protein ligase [Mariniphaga sp.]|nr:lipoate--protein ligase [Mariniphaga sp.]MDD4224988.1 lipoate--protein ligase [Mariniphaga sp.]
MLCLHLKNNDPYFCLAAEEYLLKKFSDDIFMLWQSGNTVVVGKHQNALAEINYPYVHENNVRVARRISGGGTVFHDEGNVNFAYIKNVSSPAEINFKLFTRPIVDALKNLNIPVVVSDRNDLLVGDKKISGNAEHVFKNRVLHHGTLLFNSDLEALGKAIQVAPGKYQGKAVQSNRSEVVNIRPFQNEIQTIDEFKEYLIACQLKNNENSFYELSEADLHNIRQQAEEKFHTWEWIFGYSPRYSFRNEQHLGIPLLGIGLEVNKGQIKAVTITGDYFPQHQAELISHALTGGRHSYDEIRDKLEELLFEVPKELVLAFF